MRWRRFILVSALAMLGMTSANAQLGELRHNLSVGVNAGVNLSSVEFSPTVRQ